MNIKNNTEFTFTPKVKLDTKMSFNTTPGVKNEIKKIAKENGITQSDVINQIILNFIVSADQ